MKLTDKYVFFWKDEPMCNFTKCEIKYQQNSTNTLTFTSSEQMFMWAKAMVFGDIRTAEKILNTTDPEEARKLGREVQFYDDDVWTKARIHYMKLAVFHKFYQNEDLKQQLLDAKYDGKIFVEASPYDKIWGIGYKESEAEKNVDNWGENLLGKILTELRNQLKSEEE